ncbi:MAG: hypothetical protein RJA49_1393 [Actinomycetota bacterium]
MRDGSEVGVPRDTAADRWHTGAMPRRTPLDVEIIEVLDPDDLSLPWSSASFQAPAREYSGREQQRPPQRALPWVLAALGLVTCLVIGVVLTRDHPPPPAPLAEGRFVLAGPTVALLSADEVDRVPTPDSFRMWADDAQPGGAWISVQVGRPSTAPLVARDATVATVAGVSLAVSDHEEQSLAATRDFGAGWFGEVHLHGIAPLLAATIVRGLHLGLTYSGDPVVELDNARIGALDLTPVVAADSQDTALFGTVTSEVRAMSRGVEFTLRVADGDLASRIANLRYLSHGVTTLVNDVAVTTLWDSGDAIAMWGADGRVLTITAHTDPMMVAAMADDVRGATVPEWADALRDLPLRYRLGPARTLATGSDAKGEWTAGAQLADRPGGPELLWWFSAPGDRSKVITVAASPLDGDRTTDRFVVDGVTYVFVQSRRLGGVDRAEVSVDGHTAAEVPLASQFDNGRVLLGATRIAAEGRISLILRIAPGN